MWNVKKAIYDWWFKTFWMIGETRKTRNYKLWIVDIFDSESRYQLDVWLSFTTQLFILFINIPLKCKFTKTRDRLNIEKHRSDESRRIRNIVEKIKKNYQSQNHSEDSRLSTHRGDHMAKKKHRKRHDEFNEWKQFVNKTLSCD